MSDKPLMKNDRLEVVDALRGFALLAIVLIHNVEHYNMIGQPELLPEWLGRLDEQVETAIFFLLAGKAYATFSLLFGFSFYIQLRNQRARGGDFKGRFAWRMVLLIFFSQLHALFYNGDILLLYAFMGFTLIAVCDWSDRKVFLLATICLLQPVEWIRVVCGLINPDFKSYGDLFYTYYLRAMPILEHGTLPEVLYSNITDGQLFSNLWQIENGRLFQVPALFMFGMLLGRRNYFVRSDGSVKFWKKILAGASFAFIPLYLLQKYVPGFFESQAVVMPLQIVLPSLSNFAFMAILVSSFTLFWFAADGYKFQRLLIPYGRMSLTNYIGQSIIGGFIYWGCGLGLYPYTGATACLLIGIAIFTVQLFFSRWWLARHKQGVLESLWRKGMWIGKKSPV